MPFTDYFKVLGIPITATDAEIKEAYKKLSKKFHPDLNNGDKYFEERFKEIREAYEILSNPIKKAKYLEDYHNFYNGNKKEEPINPPNHSPQPLKPKSYSWATWLFGLLAIMVVGTAIRIGSHEVIQDQKMRDAQKDYFATVQSSKIEESAKPVEVTPEVTPLPPPPTIEENGYIFGVVYYQYYSSSEEKMHYEAVTSDILSDTLSRDQQTELLYDLANDCGPVGSSPYITERKIIFANSREGARHLRIKVLEDLVKKEYPVTSKY